VFSSLYSFSPRASITKKNGVALSVYSKPVAINCDYEMVLGSI